MRTFLSWPASIGALALLTVLLTPVAPASAQGATPLAMEQLREKYVDKMDLKEEKVLGFYYTSMEGSSEGRIHNIEKAVRRINGEKINPNQIFSYNQEVGNANLEDEGWKQAGVIMNGQLVDGFGGGICQVSSTLYNAVLEAGLTVVERHSHSKTVGYVPVGQDATVAYGLLDFQFANPFDFPVKIKAKTYDDKHVVIAIVRA